MSKQQATKQPATKQSRQDKSISYDEWKQERFQKDPAEAIQYLNAMLEEPAEPELFLLALGTVAKAYGMAELAEQTNLNREGLYDMLSAKGNPRFSSLLLVLDAMGLRLTVEPKDKKFNKALQRITERRGEGSKPLTKKQDKL